jgi:nucleotide-binding universal stress UspA family protein
MYKSMLVALDGSPWAESVIPFIEQIAGPLDLQVILLHAVQPLPINALTVVGRSTEDDLRVRTAEAHDYLASLVAELRRKGIRARTEVRVGDPCLEILAGARDTGADIIGMSTHGRGGLTRMLIGSVADAVQRQAEIPVFLMRTTERELAQRRRSANP